MRPATKATLWVVSLSVVVGLVVAATAGWPVAVPVFFACLSVGSGSYWLGYDAGRVDGWRLRSATREKL